MEDVIHKNVSTYFLSHMDTLTKIIETSTGKSVDKLLAVTIYLDEEANDVLDCLCSVNDQIMGFGIKISDIKKAKEES